MVHNQLSTVCPQKNCHLTCANTVKLFLHYVYLHNISHKIRQLIKYQPAGIQSGPKFVSNSLQFAQQDQKNVLLEIAVIGSYWQLVLVIISYFEKIRDKGKIKYFFQNLINTQKNHGDFYFYPKKKEININNQNFDKILFLPKP